MQTRQEWVNDWRSPATHELFIETSRVLKPGYFLYKTTELLQLIEKYVFAYQLGQTYFDPRHIERHLSASPKEGLQPNRARRWPELRWPDPSRMRTQEHARYDEDGVEAAPVSDHTGLRYRGIANSSHTKLYRAVSLRCEQCC